MLNELQTKAIVYSYFYNVNLRFKGMFAGYKKYTGKD